MKQGWKEYFVFTHRERWAILVLVLGMAGIWGLHKAFPPEIEPVGIVWEAGRASSHETELKRSDGDLEKGSGELEQGNHDDQLQVKKFYFDPNTASIKDWRTLGLSDKQARIILNYVSKGGRFRKGEDLLKIYGLRKDQAEELVPYVRIPAAPISTFAKNQQVPEKIEINSATVEDLDKLPGIGMKLGERILKFREKLGGFYAVDQVGETFGLQDSVFRKIKPMLTCNGKVLQININTVDKTTLSTHPYFRGVPAGAILNFRDQHGPFNTVEDIKAVSVLTPEQFQKLRPYLAVK